MFEWPLRHYNVQKMLINMTFFVCFCIVNVANSLSPYTYVIYKVNVVSSLGKCCLALLRCGALRLLSEWLESHI